jgi:hypothetical protein
MASESAMRATAYSGSKRKGSNVADALFEIADALNAVAHQIKYLGNGDAATSMGAIEAYGAHIGPKLDAIAEALSGINET